MEYININKLNNRRRSVFASTQSDFFNEPIICKVHEGEKVIFTKPSLDYIGKVLTPNKLLNNWQFAFVGEIPLGKYYFDEEESNEDTKVFYFNNALN